MGFGVQMTTWSATDIVVGLRHNKSNLTSHVYYLLKLRNMIRHESHKHIGTKPQIHVITVAQKHIEHRITKAHKHIGI